MDITSCHYDGPFYGSVQMGKSNGQFCWAILMGHGNWAYSWDGLMVILMGYSDGPFWWAILVGHSGGPFLFMFQKNRSHNTESPPC